MEKYSATYIRVSSSDQVEGFSLDFQKEYCLRKAEEMGFNNLKIFADEGISAKNTDRQGLQDMLNFVLKKSNKVSAVFIYSYSRLNRNTVDFLTIKAVLAKVGINIISCTEPSQESPEGDFIQTILSAIAELDNKTKARIVSNGMHRRFLSGYVNGNPPIGYKLQKINGKTQQVPDPASFEIVKKTWHRIKEERLSLSKVAELWNTQGLKTHEKRFKKWTPKSLSKVFSNKFYIGLLNSRTYTEEPKGIHEPMISDDVFYSVRSIITGRKPDNTERRSRLNEEFVLKGVLRCASCEDMGVSRKLTGSFSKGKNGRFPYYTCPTRGKHKSISYNRNLVDDEFLKLLQDLKPEENLIKLFMTMLEEKYHSRIDMLSSSGKYIGKEIKDLEDTLSTLKFKHLKGIYSDSEYLEIKDQLMVQILDKKGLMSEKKLDTMDINAVLGFMKYYLTHLDECFNKASMEGKIAIGCSIFPQGLLFENNTFRTPQIGYGYNLKALLQSFNNTGHAPLPLVQTLDSFILTFKSVSPFVTIPS